MTRSLAIKCRELTKEFGTGSGRQAVLKGINLDLYTGGLTVLAGPSGSGKTTLLSILACTLRPTEGLTEIFGQSISDISRAQMARFRRLDVGFIFQQYNLVPALTAAENAAMPLIIAGVSHKKAIEVAIRALAKFGLADHHHKYPKQLSGGQQQRVAVARALVHRPRLVICDEPTAALDEKSSAVVMQALKDIATSEKRLVIAVTHDNRIFHYADRFIELQDGRILNDQENSTQEVAA